MWIKRLLLFLFILNFGYSHADDLYWIGNSGDWNDAEHWSKTSGGSTCQKVPADQDKVIFDENSFDKSNSIVSFDKVNIQSFYLSNILKPTFNGNEIKISNSLDIKSEAVFRNILVFDSKTNQQNSINTSGIEIGANFSLEKGIWSLNSHLILRSGYHFNAKCERLIANSNTIKADEINIAKTELDASKSFLYAIDKFELVKIELIGEQPQLVVHNEKTTVITSPLFSIPVLPISAITGVTSTCGSLTLTLDITSNFNGSDISCPGLCDGELTVSAAGTPGPYSYQLLYSGFVGAISANTVFSGLCIGTYTVKVLDSSNVIIPGFLYGSCNVIEFINEPSVFTMSVDFFINSSCPDVCDAQAFVTPAGGTGAINLIWSNGETGTQPDSLCLGPNTVVLTDANGCTVTDTVNISSPQYIAYDILVTDPSCNGDTDASLLISNETGGNGGPYTYNYNPIPITGQGTSNPSGFSAGLVTISVFDQNGCQQDSIITILNPPILSITATDLNPTSCFGVCDGSVSALPVGGVAPYTFEWFDNTTGLTTGITDSIATGICAGDYYVIVTDASNCQETSLPITISQPTEMIFNFTNTNVACVDSCTGIAVANVTGGKPIYTFTWVDLSTNLPVGGNKSTLTKLCPGEYQISVSDANGCTSTPDTAVIDNPLPIDVKFNSVTPSCYDICDGSITAVPTNTTGFIYAWDHGPSTATLSNLCLGGDYILSTTNDSGCIEIDTFTLSVPDVYDITVAQTDLVCFENTDGTIDVTVNLGGNGGPYSYSWTPAGITGDGTPNVSGLSPGNYSVLINDAAGTCDTTLTFVLNSPLDLIVTGVDIEQISCNGVCDAQISAFQTGGTPTYSFDWINNADLSSISTDSIATTLCAGSYYLKVTDANGCLDSSSVINIIQPTPIVTITTGYNLTCFDICEGAANIDVTGGSGSYTYVWTNLGTGTNVGIADSISGLCPEDYQIVVTDGTGCSTPPEIVTITNAPEMDLTLAGIDISCFNNCDGSITATLINGVNPINWTPIPSIGQGTAAAIYNNLCSGFYSIDIIDDNGCLISDTITIHDANQFDISVNKSSTSCFNGSDGFIALDVIDGGSGGPYTYSWLPNTVDGAGTDSIYNLSAGFYQVTISDGTCDSTILFTIDSPTELTVNATLINNSFCAGECNGSGEIAATGGTLGYSYLWDDLLNQASNVISDLCPGVYRGTVTDANGCTAIDSITITEPLEFTIVTNTTDNTCFDACDGTATITTLSGGTPNYIIQWNDPLNQTGMMATNLCAGIYQATITDDNNCDSIIEVTIGNPTEITFTTSLIDGACFGTCDGETSINVLGGVAPLSIEWFEIGSNIPFIDSTHNPNLCEGDYYAVITDDNGCTVTSDTLNVNEFPEIVIDLNSVTDASCGLSDGSVSISASGGTGTLIYNWLPIPGAGAGTPNISNLAGDVYTVHVTDDNNCSDSLAIGVNSNALEVLTLDSVDVSCYGLNDGEVNVSFTCIELNCAVEWFDGGGNSIGTNNSIIGLSAGLYLVELTNGLGCTVTDTIRVNEPLEIDATITSNDINCFGDQNGTADVVALGGAGGFTYNWSPNPNGGQGTPNANGLTAGLWQVTITDINNCSTDTSTLINEPSDIVIDLINATDISCNGANDGTLGVIASGGTGILSYEWFSCITGISAGTNSNLIGMAPGDYFVVITDESNCTESSNCLTIQNFQPITAIISPSEVSCFGHCNGELSAVAAGGNGTYFFQWQDDNMNNIIGQTNNVFSNVCQGNYNLLITDGNGCTSTIGPIDLTQPVSPWDVTVLTNSVTCFGDCDGSAEVTVNAGNTGPYTYQWNDPFSQTFSTATNLCAGQYNLIISDAGTCDTTLAITINDTLALNTNAIQTDINCTDDCDGQIVLSPTGGTGPYSINWSNTESGFTVANLCAGQITASIMDDTGCILDTTFNIIEPLVPLAVSSSFVNITVCGQCNGSATVNVTGGSQGYSYNWSDPTVVGQGTNQVSGLCAGLISVEITDQNNCTIIETFVIEDADGEIFTLTNSDANCFNACDGLADIAYTCISPTCTQAWIDAATGTVLPMTGISVNNLCAGDYFVELTNGLGCISAEQFTIGSPDEIIIDETISQITCGGASDGSITLVTSGGSGSGYTYNWSPVPPSGQGSNPAINLGPNTYDLTVTDGSGCTESDAYILLDTTPIIISTTHIDVSCNGTCDGTISVSASGGYGNYSIQWFFNGGLMVGENKQVIFGLCTGSYSVIVTDENGCSKSLVNPVVISEPTPINIIIGDEDISCFGFCDGMTFVTPSGGNGPYIVNWYDGATNLLIGQSNDTAFNLCIGDYYAVITDDNNCMVTSSFAKITEPTEIIFTLDQTNIDCFGNCNGDATINVSGGEPTYTYTWLDNANVQIGVDFNVLNLCSGSYTINAIDLNGCETGIQNVNILEPQQLISDLFVNQADCKVDNGSATVNVTGGIQTYIYQWLDSDSIAIIGETTLELLNAIADTFYIVVTDDNLCQDTAQVIIDESPSVILVFDEVNSPKCFDGADGNIKITATGNYMPLDFLWQPGGMIVEDPNNLSAGPYQVEVVNALGCVTIFDTIVTNPDEIIVIHTTIDPNCGVCDGEIQTTVTGGVGQLNLIWNTSEVTNDISNLCAGIYELNITDDNDCFVNKQIPLANSAEVTAEAILSPISCHDYCDGGITINILTGTAPYIVNWLDDGSNGAAKNNLCAGTYLIEVIDSNDCKFPMVIELINPISIEIEESIILPGCNANDGEISVLSTGGTAPHKYSWNPGVSLTSTLSAIGAGIYTLTIVDDNGNGCQQDFIFELSNLTVPEIELVKNDVKCGNVCDGDILANVSGGSPTYNYQWLDDQGAPIPGEINPQITNLCKGSYTLELTDKANCIAYVTDVINSPDSMNYNSPIATDVTCFGDCDGSLSTLIIGGTVPYKFQWDDPNNQIQAKATNLCAGIYELTVKDSNDCQITIIDSVLSPDVLTISLDTLINSECQTSADGEVSVFVSGGTIDYTYQWISEDNDTTFNTKLINAIPGIYILSVLDENNCNALDTFTIEPKVEVLAIAGNDTIICFEQDFMLYGTTNVVGSDLSWYDISANLIVNNDTVQVIGMTDGVELFVFESKYLTCLAYDTIQVTINPQIIVDAGPDMEVLSQGQSIIGGNPTSNLDSIVWFPSIYLNDTTLLNPIAIKPKNDTWYFVTAVDSNGCLNVDSMFLEVIPDILISGGLSPNNDGKNDVWILPFKDDFPNMEVSIYNRWGDLLFYDNSGYLIEWDGTFHDKPLPVGTYYYVIELNNEFYPDPYTGPVTIMR